MATTGIRQSLNPGEIIAGGTVVISGISFIVRRETPSGRRPEQVRGEGHLHIFCLTSTMNRFYVYILTNHHHTVFYTGFTDDLEPRVYEHKHRLLEGFTKKYNCGVPPSDKLVYYEEFISAEEALHREKQIKRYLRNWKKSLINSINPTWRDLYEDFLT